jgi:hypothetical protein
MLTAPHVAKLEALLRLLFGEDGYWASLSVAESYNLNVELGATVNRDFDRRCLLKFNRNVYLINVSRS